MDWETVGQKAVELTRRVAELEGGIPWTPPLSVKKFGAACRAAGVEPPRSSAADDEGYQAWAEARAGTGPGRWAADMAAIRRCGRYLIYRDLERLPGGRGLTAVVGGERVPLHGGIIAENWTQGTARDVMASAWLRCAAAGYEPVLSVHDELVFEVPVETAQEDLRKIVSIMERPAAWAKGLPLKVDGKLMERYGK